MKRQMRDLSSCWYVSAHIALVTAVTPGCQGALLFTVGYIVLFGSSQPALYCPISRHHSQAGCKFCCHPTSCLLVHGDCWRLFEIIYHSMGDFQTLSAFSVFDVHRDSMPPLVASFTQPFSAGPGEETLDVRRDLWSLGVHCGDG